MQSGLIFQNAIQQTNTRISKGGGGNVWLPGGVFASSIKIDSCQWPSNFDPIHFPKSRQRVKVNLIVINLFFLAINIPFLEKLLEHNGPKLARNFIHSYFPWFPFRFLKSNPIFSLSKNWQEKISCFGLSLFLNLMRPKRSQNETKMRQNKLIQ